MSFFYNSTPAYQLNEYWEQSLANPRQAILPVTTNTEDAKLCAFPHTFALKLEQDASKSLAFTNAVTGDGKTPEISLNYQETPRSTYTLSQQPLNQGEAEYLIGLFRACLGSTIGFYVEQEHLPCTSDLSALWRFESQTISLQIEGYDPNDLENNFYQISDAKLVSISNSDVSSFFNPKIGLRPHVSDYKNGSLCKIEENYNCQDVSVIAWSGVSSDSRLGVGIILPVPNGDLAQSVEFDSLAIAGLISVNSSIFYRDFVYLACWVNGVAQVYRYDPFLKQRTTLAKVGFDLTGIPQKLFIYLNSLYLITDSKLYWIPGQSIEEIYLSPNFSPLDALIFSDNRLFVGGYIANTAVLLESNDGSNFNQVVGVPQSFTACAIASLLEVRGDLLLLVRDTATNQAGLRLHELPNGKTQGITTSDYIEVASLASIWLPSISRIRYDFLLGHYYFAVGNDLWMFDGRATNFHSLSSLGMPSEYVSDLISCNDGLLFDLVNTSGTYLFNYLPQSNDTVMQLNRCMTLAFPESFLTQNFVIDQTVNLNFRGDGSPPNTFHFTVEAPTNLPQNHLSRIKVYFVEGIWDDRGTIGTYTSSDRVEIERPPEPILIGSGSNTISGTAVNFIPVLCYVRLILRWTTSVDLVEKRFLADGDRPIYISGQKFHSRHGLEVSNLSFTSDLAIDNGEASINLGDFIDDNLLSEDIIRFANRVSSATPDLNANAIKFVLAVIDRASYNTTHQRYTNQILMSGEIGEIKINHAKATLELASLKSKLQNNSVLRTTSYCQNVLGDRNCQVNLEPLSNRGTVTNLYDRAQFFGATLDTPIPSTDYYLRGRLQWLSGENIGVVSEVGFQSNLSSNTLQIGLWEIPPYPIQVNDIFKIEPGCDRSISTCHAKFNNVPLYRGFPWLPGTDRYLAGSNLSAPG